MSTITMPISQDAPTTDLLAECEVIALSIPAFDRDAVAALDRVVDECRAMSCETSVLHDFANSVREILSGRRSAPEREAAIHEELMALYDRIHDQVTGLPEPAAREDAEVESWLAVA